MTKSNHARLEDLRAEHLKASGYAAEVLRKYGEDSPQFAEADKIAADISARIQELEEK
ncbi:MAG TPA: hypothetical protein VMD53_12230 [Rhizomicrobium sp.]|nr:hypothetical protein [Rhizomicrobium sp.]